MQRQKSAFIFGMYRIHRLSAMLTLFNLKAINGWPDKIFNELFELLKDMASEGYTFLSRKYDAKKILCLIRVEYKKVHAYPNDFILHQNEFEQLHQSPMC